MNKNQLEYFVSVAELGNFTKAAQKHFVSQTAVTQQIQNLEEMLHIQLFDRTRRPVQLTDAGTAFLVDAKAILERMNDAVSKVNIVSTSGKGTIRLGCTYDYGTSRLSRLLRLFRRNHPNVFFTSKEYNTGDLVTALLNDELDIIFTWGNDDILNQQDMAGFVMEESTLDVLFYNTHPFVNRTQLTRADLKDEDIIYLAPSNSLIGDTYLQRYIETGFEPKIIHYSDNINDILPMVAAEEGITVVPSYITQTTSDLEGIDYIPLTGQNETASIVAVWKESNSNALVESFAKYIEENK